MTKQSLCKCCESFISTLKNSIIATLPTSEILMRKELKVQLTVCWIVIRDLVLAQELIKFC